MKDPPPGPTGKRRFGSTYARMMWVSSLCALHPRRRARAPRRTSILSSQRFSGASFFWPLLIRWLTISSALSFSASVSIGLGSTAARSSAYLCAVPFLVLAIAVIFPLLPAVFSVRQDESNQDGLILVVNFGNKPVLVPADNDPSPESGAGARGLAERQPCDRVVE